MSIFQTRAWQQAWWDTWGDTPGFSLLEPGGAGCSGLYLDHYRFRQVLPIRCLQFIGTNYRRISTPRTEYNSLGLDNNSLKPEARKHLEANSWSEAVFRDIRDNTPEYRALLGLAREHGWSVRIVDQDEAYTIDTRGDFDSYIASLGSNTRLRLYNRRKVLESCGEIVRQNLWPSDPDRFFELLNEFHQARWGQPCFGQQSLAFHKQFLANVEMEGGVPELSVLSCDQNLISVIYNVAFRGTVYNIQSGFLESFNRKLALGTLHLGYCIEDAFQDPAIDTFDMLAGGGKNENYKKRLATTITPLVSVMFVRNRLLKLLYWLKS